LLVIGSSVTDEELESDAWQSTILQRYGSGQYKLMLNDAGLKKPVCQTVIEVNDDEFPPVVEIEQLTLDHPSNRSYIERLRARGVQIPGEESAEDMATESAMTKLVDTVQDLSARNAALIQQRPQQQQPPPRQDEGVAATAAKAGMDIIASAAKMGNSLVDSAINKVAEVQAKAQTAAADPMASLRSLVDVVKAIQPPPPPAADPSKPTEMTLLINLLTARETSSQTAITELQKQLFTMQTNHMAFVEKVATGGDKPTTAAQAQAAANPQPKSLADQLKELAAIKDTLGDMFGGDTTPARSGNWMDHLPTIIQGAGIIAASISNGMYNYAVAKSGSGIPQPLSAAAALPPATDELGQGGPTMPAHAPMQGPPGVEVTGYQMFLEKVREPLLHSLNSGDTGHDFAAKLADYEGLLAYETLRGMGKESILALLSTYPPIWQVVSQVPARFDQFLDEFITGPLEEDDSGDGADADQPPQTQPTTQPSPRARRKGAVQ
jgi:hypothetical protein